MNTMDNTERLLASYVALRVDDWKPKHGCPAWVESRDSTCGKKPSEGPALCKRHRTVAQKKYDAKLAKLRQQHAQRQQYQQDNLQSWKDQLAKVEADISHYGDIGIDDRAAVGGVSHPSIRRKQARHLSNTNVQRMAKLTREADELRDKIAAAERYYV